ncbi:MAG: hypothetical protein D4S01_06610 [Dehalococcoidia bacterium]|nr:MAG: hypothetical protein D4S01_06610 [Dehalococcoidia bacterium]
MNITKTVALTLLTILVISASITSIFVYNQIKQDSKEEFFFGVTYGQNTIEEAKILIDQVKNYTNLFIINSSPITTNTNPLILNEICDYAAKANLHFIVYFFSFLSGPWQQEWLDIAKQTWGEKFLGVYLRDEHGGRQIDLREPIREASNYSDAATQFIQTISTSFSMKLLHDKTVPVFTSDFTLYHYDYLAGFNTVFAEFGWNNSRVREIALCRGAANMLKEDWGTIITWTYMQPPYIANSTEIYQDMVTAYNAGAKYVIVFNYPQYPEDNQYGILNDEHFSAMKQFWYYAASCPRGAEKITAQVAYLLPKDYGWGMRRLDDKIWGIWDADEKSQIIWENLNKLETKYGLKLDIIYDDARYNPQWKYYQVYLWNATIN